MYIACIMEVLFMLSHIGCFNSFVLPKLRFVHNEKFNEKTAESNNCVSYSSYSMKVIPVYIVQCELF